MIEREVRMPRFDPVMEEGKISQWLKNENERVNEGEPIVVVEGEKTSFEIESPTSGIIKKTIYREGDVVRVGDVIAIISEETREEHVVHASPLARKLAEQYGIDLKEVIGTGPEGRITRDDVIKVAKEKGLLVEEAEAKPSEEVTQLSVLKSMRLEGIRKAIADKLGFSFRNAIPVTITMEFLAENLLRVSQRMREIAITSFFIKACAKALLEHKELNSTIEDGEIKIYSNVNIAIAVDTPRGLMAPVIRNVEQLTIEEISRKLNQLVEKSRTGRLSPEETLGHTFTISNLGGLGVDVFTPIINPPACAILGIGEIRRRAVVINTGIYVKPVGTLSLVFDHRIVDGVPAANFLKRVRELIEKPEEFLEA